MKILFLNESGDHSLSVIDPQYPVFVLGGVIFDADYAANEVQAAVHRFKLEVLGHSDVTLHTADIVRQQGPFAMLVDPGRRRAFRDGLNALMRRLDYTVIACAIRKDAHLAAYGAAALDPYTLSLTYWSSGSASHWRTLRSHSRESSSQSAAIKLWSPL